MRTSPLGSKAAVHSKEFFDKLPELLSRPACLHPVVSVPFSREPRQALDTHPCGKSRQRLCYDLTMLLPRIIVVRQDHNIGTS